VRDERRRVAAWIAGLMLGALIVVGVVVGFRLVRIANDLRQARTLIDSASSHIEQGQLGPARTELSRAQRLLTATNGKLYGQPELELVGWVPVVHENLESLRTSVGLALRMVSGGNTLLEVTKPLENKQGKLEVSLHHGAIPLQTVRSAESAARELAQVLPGESEEPSSARLVGPVAELQHKIYAQALRRHGQLNSVSRALALLSDMAGGNGDRRYLIAVANTAEMRGAGGMILSYGVLQSTNGTFTLGDFGPIDDLAITEGVDPSALKLPSDYLARWDGFEPTRLWRNTTLAPDFQLDAPVMAAMFAAKTGLPVDGVIQIDPSGLAAILEGTGPVEVPTVGSVSADNVVDLTINRAYIDFPNRDQRQEISADVAKAAFHALIDGDFGSLRPFGTALFRTAAARHLMFYASSPVIKSQVHFFGADGALPDPAQQDTAILTVQNVSKNKLDYYVDTSLSLSGARPAGRMGSITAVVTVTNSAPNGITADYITGPRPPGRAYAVYEGIVSLYLPTGTTLAGSDGSDVPALLTTEAGRTLVTYDVSLPAGASSTVTLNLNLVPRPAGRPYAMTVLPVGRVRPTRVSVDVDLGDRRRATGDIAALEKVTVFAPQNK
jgi:hypothetical protein